MQYCYYDSPLGRLLLASKFGILQQIKFAYQVEDSDWKYSPKVFAEVTKQLTEYFLQQRKNFTIDYNLLVTPFQKLVLQQVAATPYAETTTYSKIAQQIAKPNAARAVGAANHHNPLPIIIPCHRVIGKNGNLVGFAAGLNNKQKLLELERTAP